MEHTDALNDRSNMFSFHLVCNRFMPDVPEAVKQTDNKRYVETAFGVLCNMPLLCNHSASWEILVSKRHISDYNTDGNIAAHIPVNRCEFFFFNQQSFQSTKYMFELCARKLFCRFYFEFIIRLAMVWHCCACFWKRLPIVNIRKRIYGRIAYVHDRS